MFFIVICHMASYTNGLYSSGASLNKAIVSLLELSGCLCDNIFILISGYFLITAKFSPVRIIKIILQTWFLSTAIYLVMCAVGAISFSSKYFVVHFFPILCENYWFITAYILLGLFSPLINIALRAMGRKNHFRLIVLSLAAFSVIPTILKYITVFSFDKFSFPNNQYSAVLFFIVIYSIGAYIRLYPEWKFSAPLAVVAAIASVAAQVATVMILYALSSSHASALNYIESFIGVQSILQVIPALAIFMLVKNAKPWTNKIVNIAASSVLGVYIIHQAPCLRSWTLEHVFDFEMASPVYVLTGKLFLYALAIFFVCLAVDLLRKYLVERPVFKLIGGKINSSWEKIKIKLSPKENG